MCDGPLASTRRDGSPQVQCHRRGHIRVDETELNDYAERVMLAYLRRPDIIDQLRSGQPEDGELAAVRDTLAQARSELAALRHAVGAGTLSVASLVAAEPGPAGTHRAVGAAGAGDVRAAGAVRAHQPRS